MYICGELKYGVATLFGHEDESVKVQADQVAGNVYRGCIVRETEKGLAVTSVGDKAIPVHIGPSFAMYLVEAKLNDDLLVTNLLSNATYRVTIYGSNLKDIRRGSRIQLRGNGCSDDYVGHYRLVEERKVVVPA